MRKSIWARENRSDFGALRKHGGFDRIWFGALRTIVMEMELICMFPGIATVLPDLVTESK